MYRSIIAVAIVVVALASAGLLFLGPGEEPDRALLAHVPAGTVFYSGYTDPSLPLAEASDMWGPLDRVGAAAGDKIDPAEAADEGGPAAGMLAGLYRSYLSSVAEDEHPLARFGVSSDNIAAAYAVGALPVLRISMADTQAFWHRIDAIEAMSRIEASSEPLSQGKQRRYPFKTGGTEGELDLVIAANNGYAIVTLAGSGFNDKAVALALGESQPEQSLRDTGRLDELAKRHGTLPTATGFIDHQALAAALTGASNDRFATMLARLLNAWGVNNAVLTTLRNPACQQDLGAIAEQWPYTSFGITRLDTNTRELGTRTNVAIADEALRSRLDALRGHIPEPVAGRPIAGAGLGLNAETLARTVQKLARDFTGSDFQCPPLRAAQRAIGNQPLNQLGMATAMISDVRGISAAVTDLAHGRTGSLPFRADAVIEIATPKPTALWQFAQQSLGLPVDKRPQAGGDPVRIDLPMVAGMELKVAIRDNALLVVTGDARLDGAAGESDTEPNGILQLRYDYGRMTSAIMDRIPGNGRSLPDRARLERIDAYYDMRIDTDDHGLRLDATVAPAPEE